MTTDGLSTALASVTSSAAQRSCLPVQVPVAAVSTVSNVGVGVGVPAAVGIIAGVLVAALVGWLISRCCFGKVRCTTVVLWMFVEQPQARLSSRKFTTSPTV